MDFVNEWSEKTELPIKQFITWLDIHKSKFYTCHARYGKVNEHNGKVPRDFWLENSEKKAILDFEQEHPDEGYRRLTYMMMDNAIVAASPASVWRVLSAAGRLEKWNKKSSTKGAGFVQPLQPHERWHKSLKHECILPGTPLTLDDAKRLIAQYVSHYNYRRLHSAIGYITLWDKLQDRAQQIFEARDKKLHEARERRKARRKAAA